MISFDFGPASTFLFVKHFWRWKLKFKIVSRRLWFISLVVMNWWLRMISLALNVHLIVREVINIVWIKDYLGVDLLVGSWLFLHLLIKGDYCIRILSFLLAVLYNNYLIVRLLFFCHNILLFVSMIIVQVDHSQIIQIPIKLSEFLILFIINYFPDFQVLGFI